MKVKSMMAALFLAATVFTSAKAQTADEIVNKYITAIGGTEKLRAINSVVRKGTLNANGMKIPINSYTVNGKGMRQDYTVNGMTGFTILTSTDGWNYNPFMGQSKAEPMTADDVKKDQDELDATDDLLDYASKGTTVEYLGTDDVEGTECYKLKLTMKSGKEKTAYISTEDNMLVKTSEKVTANGQEQEASVMYSNYKEVNGIKFAFSINSPFGPIDFDSIEINTEVDDALFQPSK